ncbi:hypothetical protein ACUXCC_000498 [Cytobacillus horneckiae]|uniref:Uncharacterized protein n=1 Tax=Cytobacillus horneckiae TaxID=549687 RepID=A0A2N0ZDU0_9BACI|nr:hypothetical protein [Cytobacillus horneckiae]MBN6885361.1 hypothetical protein [Cytobacillus horneckiae]MEC1154126.1 hypothetical protein [Cytobacillus horneckiae]MED2936329.1 hypothetical protein [Cytobacillus horneckiae]PKG27679.1 hypothetical protein CWS20_17660 [Cytobacillus horneckiae]
MNDIILNTLIGLGTGLVSGVVSGFYVSGKFKKKEEVSNWKKELDEDKQIMVRYLDMIQFELNLIREKIKLGQNYDTETLKRVLVDEPRTLGIIEEKITNVSIKHISGTRKLINEIREDLNQQKQLLERDIIRLDSRIIRSKFDVLSIKAK